jgi:hypothetical protein
MLHVATMRADNIMGLVGVAADPGALGRSPVNFVFCFLSANSGRISTASIFFFKFIVAADPHFTETLVNTQTKPKP